MNLHAGIDAWGRPFDAEAAVRALNGDITILQECWSPPDGPSFAERVARSMDAVSIDAEMATGRRALPHDDPPDHWHRRKAFLDGDHSLYLDSEVPLSPRILSSSRYGEAEHGVFGLGVISRFPVMATSVITLDRVRKDRARRVLIFLTLEIENQAVLVVATHMTHLTYGSPLHFAKLRRSLRTQTSTTTPVILGGDMNLWGPPATLQLPGLRRAVKGRTWPAWGPHSQVDHLFVNRLVVVESACVEKDVGSDHLPVSAVLRTL